MRSILTTLAITLFLAMPTRAAIKTEWIEYKHGDTNLKGFLAYDDAASGKRPGVLVFPEWWGLTEYPQNRAQQLAGLGYVAFVADMYGDAKTTTDPKEAQKLSGAVYADPDMLRSRAAAALTVLVSRAEVDSTKVGA